MASVYTTNNGIELIGTGEKSGTWGDITNQNFEIIDASLDGQISIELASAGSSGSPNTVNISEGQGVSDGNNRMFIFTDGASFSGDAYVQLTPNDAEKIVYIRNNFSSSSPRSIIVFQGNYDAANAYTVPRGKTAVIYFNGAGLGAVAANIFNNAHFDALNLVGNADVGGNLTVTGDVVAGDDVSLQSDGAVLNFGADNDVSLSHVADTAIRINSDKALQFRDAAISIASSADGQLDIDADTEVEITTTTLDIDATTVDISATNFNVPANSIALSTDTTGNYVASVTGGTGLNSTGSGEGAAVNVSLSAAYGDDENPYGSKSANLVLAGPSSGSNTPPSFRSLVAADIPSLAISKVSGLQNALDDKLDGTGGNASSASKWQSPITLTLGTDLTGNVSFDGQSNVTLNASVVNNSHTHTISNVTGLQNALDDKLDETGGAISGNVTISGTLAVGSTYAPSQLYIGYPAFNSGTHYSNPVKALQIGTGSTVYGHGGIAMGANCVSGRGGGNGRYAIAAGISSTATYDYAIAMGIGCDATQEKAVALGGHSEATGIASFAAGQNSEANGHYSIAMGYYSNGLNQGTVALGYSTDARGLYSTSIGRDNSALSNYCVAIGSYNTAGDTSGNLSADVGATAIGYGNEATAQYATALGYSTNATGQFSTSMGDQTTASGSRSTAMGYVSTASGDRSTAMGAYTSATGTGSTSMGWDTEANGAYSTAMGREINVDGNYSFGIGLNNPSSEYELTQANTMAIMGGKVGVETLAPTNTFEVNGNIKIDGVTETFGTYSTNITSSSTLTADASSSKLWRVTSSSISGSWTIDVTNINLEIGDATNLTFVLESGTGTSHIPSTFKISGSPVTIKWQGGSTPTGDTGTAPVNVYSFTVFRTGSSAYTVLGNHVSFDS
jgi:hypothetical protein